MSVAYNRVLDRFREHGLIVQPTGRGASCQAPGHSKHDRSVSVTPAQGMALVYSHSDPTDDVLRALGLSGADLFDSPRDMDTRWDNGRAEHRSYKDGRKQFAQSGTENPPELLQLALTREAVKAGKAIYVCEGPKDVRALESLGVVATTNPQGAGNWDKVDYSPLLGASAVYVVADRDEAGMKRARGLATHLREIGVRYAGTLLSKVGDDAADHVAAGHGLDAFVNLATAEHDAAVEAELARLRAQREARRLLDDEHAPPAEPPRMVRLDEFLAEPDEDAEYRIDQLMPTGANVVVAAQFKAGKSTLVGNVLGALAGAEPFLGQFDTVPAGRVVLLDNELDPRTMRRWLRAHNIEHPERVELVSLRGALSSFNIIDPTVRAEWAQRVGAADVLILDCLRPVLDALGLDENRDAGKFLVAFDALKTEAGIDEGFVVHHMGHNGERSRGDSRILDWPDVTWRIVRESDDPASPRYFSAFGRDVDIPEGRLHYDHDTRALTYGEGTRREARDAETTEEMIPAVLDYVTTNPGCSGQMILKNLPGGDRGKRQARKALVADGRIVEVKAEGGRGGGFRYFPRTPATPAEPQRATVQTPATPVYRRGAEVEADIAEPRQQRNDDEFVSSGDPDHDARRLAALERVDQIIAKGETL